MSSWESRLFVRTNVELLSFMQLLPRLATSLSLSALSIAKSGIEHVNYSSVN